MAAMATSPLKYTALHHKHLALGATMVDDSGWQRPERYGPAEEELKAVREGVGLCDISPVGKLDLKGKQIARVFESLFSLRDLTADRAGTTAGSEEYQPYEWDRRKLLPLSQ